MQCQRQHTISSAKNILKRLVFSFFSRGSSAATNQCQGQNMIPNQGSLALIKEHICWAPVTAVSTPIFAKTYSFCSIFKILQDSHTFESI